MKICAWKLGLAGGILWGLWIFAMTLVADVTGFGMFWLSQWMDLYIGYELSPFGACVGLVWGFVEGFIALFLLAWIYNLMNRRSV